MDIRNTLIKEFLDELNSTRVQPSAGASLAITGALGASLIGMVCKITLKRINSHSFEDLAMQTTEFAEKLLDFGNEDMTAFSAVLRNEEGATTRAMEIPLEMARACIDVMNQYEPLHNSCYEIVKGDAEAGFALLMTCGKGNIELAKKNLSMFDLQTCQSYEAEIKEIETILNSLELGAEG